MKSKRNAAYDSRPTPGLNVRELIEERNWAALIGLSLIGVGVLVVVQNLLGVSLNLWSLLLLGLGGWMVWDAWQTYDQQGRAVTDHVRNRLIAGGLIALVGLMGALDVNWWGVLLLAVGGGLGWDAWQHAEANGGVWTEHNRNRLIVAGIVGAFGLFGLLNVGGAWAVVLIGIGAFMLYRHFSARA